MLANHGIPYAYEKSFVAQSCVKFKPSKKNNGNTCDHCQQSAVSHKLIVRKQDERSQNSYVLKLFCSLRNFRRIQFIVQPLEGCYTSLQDELKNNLRTIRLLKGVSDIEALFKYVDSVLRLFPFSQDDRAKTIIACDEVYYHLYYAMDLTWRTRHQTTECPIPQPHEYFSKYVADETTLELEMKGYIKSSFTPAFKQTICDIFGLTDRLPAQQDNPLLYLHYLRWRESVCFFHNHLLKEQRICTDTTRLITECKTTSYSSVPTHATMKPHGDPLIPPLVRAWNDSCRTWACHLYAYATPSPQALDLLQSYSPLIELGAGTGYWAYVLRRRHPSVVIHAYDKDPPGCEKHSKSNSYHGRAAAWTTLLKGGVETIGRHPQATLFLCYPPPDSDMAVQALRQYKGRFVCYCGEYRGDTGTKSFEQLLEQSFICIENLVLPNWVDTCYSLTVWQRRDNTMSDTKAVMTMTNKHPLCCVNCGVLKQSMYRCRISYLISVCSAECAGAGRSKHLNELAYKFILCYQFNTVDTNDVSTTTVVTSGAPMSKNQKKKERKRRREEAKLEGKSFNNYTDTKRARTEVNSENAMSSNEVLSSVPVVPVFPINSGLFAKISNKSCSVTLC